VLALLACVPLGVIFGIIALVEAKRARRAGHGLALAAIAISALWAAGAVGFYIVRHTGDLVVGTTQSGETLSVGDCVDKTPQCHLGGAEAGWKHPVGCRRAGCADCLGNARSELEPHERSLRGVPGPFRLQPGGLDQRLNRPRPGSWTFGCIG
jgi:hypothetical protein